MDTAFELSRFGTEERDLFFSLPMEDRYMGFGVIGHLRGELYHCGFSDMWITDRKSLMTLAFSQELKSLRSTLRNKFFNGSTESMELCRTAQSIDGRDTGFRISSDHYTYYLRCTPLQAGFDITMYAYDNSFLWPELAGLHELPEKCYAVENGQLYLLQQDTPQKLLVDAGGTAEENQAVCDDLNAKLGVTKAQAAAMCMGIQYSFCDPCAWPWQYDQNGEPRCNAQKNTEKGAR